MTDKNNNDDEIIINNEDVTFGDEDDHGVCIEDDDSVAEKYVIPYKYNHKSDTVTFQFYSDEERCIYPVTGHFEIMITPYGLNFNEERFQRMCDVIDNLVGSIFLTTNSEINPLYCNGTINNISFELPTSDISVPCIVSFLYYKCEAVLGNYGSIIMFKFVPTYNKHSIYVDIPTHRQQNPYICEEDWMQERADMIEDMENDPEFEFEFEELDKKEYLKPWWHRDDESTRDYFYGSSEHTEPVHIIMELTPPLENEVVIYPLYTPETIERAFQNYEQDDQGDATFEGTPYDDIVDANKNRITVEEMMTALAQISSELDTDGDSEDSDSGNDDSGGFVDDEIVIGSGRE